MENIRNYHIIKKQVQSFNKFFLKDLGNYFAVLMIITWGLGYIIAPSLMYIYTIDLSLFIIIGLPIYLISIVYMFKTIKNKLNHYIKNFFKQILIEIDNMLKDINNTDGLDIILIKIKHIYTILWRVRVRKVILRFITTKKTRHLFSSTHLSIVTFLQSILTDLRSDLATRLTEQQQILESAKSEVEKNMVGTPELLAVSEAQKLRLDRQIEQFEELQRVLVKV